MTRDDESSLLLLGFMIAAVAGSLVGFIIGRMTA